jgi:hypothetical protein
MHTANTNNRPFVELPLIGSTSTPVPHGRIEKDMILAVLPIPISGSKIEESYVVEVSADMGGFSYGEVLICNPYATMRSDSLVHFSAKERSGIGYLKLEKNKVAIETPDNIVLSELYELDIVCVVAVTKLF